MTIPQIVGRRPREVAFAPPPSEIPAQSASEYELHSGSIYTTRVRVRNRFARLAKNPHYTQNPLRQAGGRSWCNRPWVLKKSLFAPNRQNLGDRKCLGDPRKSLVGLPNAISFLRIWEVGVFQHPRLLTTVTALTPSSRCKREAAQPWGGSSVISGSTHERVVRSSSKAIALRVSTPRMCSCRWQHLPNTVL